MRYPRYILAVLMLFCTSGLASFAQTDLVWKSLNLPQVVDVRAMAVDDDGGMYAAVLPEGIYYAPPSSDGVPSWSPLGSLFKDAFGGGATPADILSITLSKGTPRVIYAIVGGRRIVRLEPGSNVWKNVSAGFINSDVPVAVVVDSRGNAFCTTRRSGRLGDPGLLYKFDEVAGLWQPQNNVPYYVANITIGRSDALFIGIGHGRVYRSTDAGGNWSLVTESRDAAFPYQPSLVSGPDGDIYVLWRNLWRSTDNGNTWTMISRVPEQPFYGGSLVVVSQDEIYLQIGTASSFYATTDRGVTWTRPALELKAWPVRVLAAGAHSYVAGRGMLLRSIHGSTSWEKVYTAPISQKVFMHAFDEGRGVMMVSHNSWFSISTDGGQSWKTDTALPATLLRVDRKGNLLVGSVATEHIAVGSGGKLLRSTDSGATWIARPLPVAGIIGGIRTIDDIEVDSLGRIYVLITTPNSKTYLMISEDDGATWELRSTGVPAERRTLGLMLDPYGRLYAAVDSAGVFRSSDAGYNWDTMFDITQGRNIARMAFHPSGDVIAIGEHSIVRYDHTTFRTEEQMFPGMTLSDIVISPGGFCVVATSDGVMLSENGRDWTMSANWRKGDDGISGGPNVAALWVDLDEEGIVYAGTREHGVWSARTGGVASAGDRPARLRFDGSLALSPNPAADHLTLRYTAAEGAEATIVLHDLFGRSVRTVPAGHHEPGEMRIDLDLRDLPNGTYIVGVKIGDAIRASAPVVIAK